MANLKVRRVTSPEIEKRILIGGIVSTSFCHSLFRIYQPELIQMGYIREVFKWVQNYYENYKTAPGIHIQDLYNTEKEKFKEADREIVETLLASLSDEYERTEQFNAQYLTDQAEQYFHRRSLEVLFEKGKGLVLGGKVREADQLLVNHRQLVNNSVGMFNPFDEQEINNWEEEDNEDRLFTFPGALGQLLGWWEREWLVSWMGPEKRGKSWALMETAFQALSHRLKVVMFSLEMSKKKVKGRIFGRLTGLPSGEEKVITYPIFDCQRNQDDRCNRKDRIKSEEPFPGKGNYSPNSKYQPCDVCRGKSLKEGFIPAIWYRTEKFNAMTRKALKKKAETFRKLYSNNFRVKCFPAFSANSKDIRAELDSLEYYEGFVPDVVIIDYVDILGKEDDQLSERENIDRTWKMFKNLAASRHCLVVTAEQGNKQSGNATHMEAAHVTEDKRKNAHVDLKLGLNQKTEEKPQQYMRVSVILSRHADFNPTQDVTVLQQLNLAQPAMDSEFMTINIKK